MWTKVMIFLIVFFIIANPATFKIMRGVLGAWVASAEGLATPAGLILHSLVFVGLAILVPKYLMRSSYYEDEDYEDEDTYEDEDYEDEDYEDEDYRLSREERRARRAARRAAKTSSYEDEDYEDEEFRMKRTEHKRRALLREAALKAAGEVPPPPPMAPTPPATTSPYEDEEYRRRSRKYWAKRNKRAKAALKTKAVKDPIA